MQKQLFLLSCNIYVFDVGTHLTSGCDMRNAHKYTCNNRHNTEGLMRFKINCSNTQTLYFVIKVNPYNQYVSF